MLALFSLCFFKKKLGILMQVWKLLALLFWVGDSCSMTSPHGCGTPSSYSHSSSYVRSSSESNSLAIIVEDVSLPGQVPCSTGRRVSRSMSSSPHDLTKPIKSGVDLNDVQSQIEGLRMHQALLQRALDSLRENVKNTACKTEVKGLEDRFTAYIDSCNNTLVEFVRMHKDEQGNPLDHAEAHRELQARIVLLQEKVDGLMAEIQRCERTCLNHCNEVFQEVSNEIACLQNRVTSSEKSIATLMARNSHLEEQVVVLTQEVSKLQHKKRCWQCLFCCCFPSREVTSGAHNSLNGAVLGKRPESLENSSERAMTHERPESQSSTSLS